MVEPEVTEEIFQGYNDWQRDNNQDNNQNNENNVVEGNGQELVAIEQGNGNDNAGDPADEPEENIGFENLTIDEKLGKIFMECRKLKKEVKECKKTIKTLKSDISKLESENNKINEEKEELYKNFCKTNAACIKYKKGTNTGFGSFIGGGFAVVIPLLLKYIGVASLFSFPVGGQMYVGFTIFGGVVGGIIGRMCTSNKPKISIKK
ncbi:unnamed protein product [Meloidogyne enterolobii]|uniref:Uncharacterized protein n=1 Tax=Meloidogyne enterolobii TaxID=390850 RepID=A0ACB0ZFC2_MELEN